MHRGSRGVNREGVRGMHVLLKLAFKLSRLWAGREPPRLKRVDNFVDLFLADRWHVKRYEWHLLHVFLYGRASERLVSFGFTKEKTIYSTLYWHASKIRRDCSLLPLPSETFLVWALPLIFAIYIREQEPQGDRELSRCPYEQSATEAGAARRKGPAVL